MPTPLLFSPCEIREVRLKNRIVIAPMHQYAAVDGFSQDWHLVNAGRFATGGAGLVMVESTRWIDVVVARWAISACGTTASCRA